MAAGERERKRNFLLVVPGQSLHNDSRIKDRRASDDRKEEQGERQVTLIQGLLAGGTLIH